MKGPLFSLGRILGTPAALAAMQDNGIDGLQLLGRHVTGDWGDVCAEDAQANDRAVAQGTRLLSAYDFPGGSIWIITEADRSATTILLPEDY